MECEESVTTKQGVLPTPANDWNESRVNCLARLEVLSCSATASVTFSSPARFTRVPALVTCQSQDLCKVEFNQPSC